MSESGILFPLSRVTTALDTGLWHKVTSGVWFGKIPPDLYPLYTHPEGRLVKSGISLPDTAKWSISAGGVFNSAHNLSHMTLGLMVKDTNGHAAVAQICGPQRISSPGLWGIAYGDSVGFGQTPEELGVYGGSWGSITLDNFPRSDDQTFTVSMMLADGALTLSLVLNGTSYTLHTEQSYNTAVFAASLANPFSLRVNMNICGTAKDQYEEVDDGEGGYNYVGSPVCVLDWVNFASVG